MLPNVRRLLVAGLALAMALSLAGPAGAATLRSRPRDIRPNPDVVLRGSGWGHGVGMSQYGAYAQARAGRGYREILHHYYSGIAIGKRTMPAGIRVGLHSSLDFSNVDAVTGAIPWRSLVNGKWVTKWQPKGSTWKVSRTSTGAFRLNRTSDGARMWLVKTSRLLASFNPKMAADGTIVEAYNPNYDQRSLYKWGRLEYAPSATKSGAMNLVIDIPSMERYLRGLAESISSWGVTGGDAALKAQAVVGRSYAMVLRGSYESYCRCHIGATPGNQTYLGWDHEGALYGSEWVDAVRDTAGMVATYNGTPIEAFYSSSHGGRTENIEDSWAYSATYGYLRSTSDPWSLRAESGNPNASWDFPVSNASFSSFAGGFSRVRRVRVVGTRTDGGTPKTIRVWGLDSAGDVAARTITGRKGIVGVSLMDSYRGRGLKSQQIRRFGFAPFLDDDGSVHEYPIVYATRARIMTGKTATRFAPRGTVSRAGAAVYLYRTLRLDPSTHDYYRDDNHLPAAVQEAINALARAGITARTARFRPDADLTRAQAAGMFFRALDLKTTTRDYYTDDESSPHEAAINSVTRRGLLGACGAGRFCPGRAVKRGPMATLLLRSVNVLRSR